MKHQNRVFPAEWHPQSAVQLTWPHRQTDWAPILEEAIRCFVAIGREIAKSQKLLIICDKPEEIAPFFENDLKENLLLVSIKSNDTWARDHGAISVLEKGKPILLDFGFNGWGNKFEANLDNQINRQLRMKKIFQVTCDFENHLDFILEGGAIESDGKGTILTSAACLLNPNRNPALTQTEIENYLKKALGAKRILWLSNGYLAGDDTDSHIDTLARFCNEDTIAYVKCTDPNEEHFRALAKMEEELKQFEKEDGKAYNLIALPMADPVFDNKERLPATYANFLIINGKVLLPFYGSSRDEIAKVILQKVFPSREVIGIDCKVLIKQHGSLHCVTMHYPEGII